MIKHVLDATDPTRMKYQHIATLHRRIDDIQRRHQRYVDLLVAHQRQELSFLHQVAASNNLKNGVPSPRGGNTDRAESDVAGSFLPDIVHDSGEDGIDDVRDLASTSRSAEGRKQKRGRKRKGGPSFRIWIMEETNRRCQRTVHLGLHQGIVMQVSRMSENCLWVKF